MSVRKTIQIGNPILKAKNSRVTDFHEPKVAQVIQDLIDTMYSAELIGIAAPQIGENYQIFVTEPRQTNTRSKDQADSLRIFINPELVSASKETVKIYEGCGSVVEGILFGPVCRPKTITVRAHDKLGALFEFTADGILGRVIQHELDHVLGIEFMEKVSDYRQMMTSDHYIKLVKDSPDHIEATKIHTKKQIYL